MDQPARRGIAVVGAASSIGIRPYDDRHEARHLDRAPGVLRDLNVVPELDALDLGDVPAPPYRDFIRPPGGIRNEALVRDYIRALAARVASGLADDRFVLVLGGDCSIVLGGLLGARQSGRDRVGIAYVDAHADFATPEESITGSAAAMCLAMAAGRGDSALSRLAGPTPLVRAEDAVVIGRRDLGQDIYGDAALAASGALDLSTSWPGEQTGADAAAAALERLTRPGIDGFWIHVDADVLNPQVMPAVDSPEPGGPDLDELAALVAPLVRHPRALGMELTIYDPALDPGRDCARRLVTFLEGTLANILEGARR